MGKFQQQHLEFVNTDFRKMAELLFEKVSVASAEAAGLGEQFDGELKVQLPDSQMNPQFKRPLGIL